MQATQDIHFLFTSKKTLFKSHSTCHEFQVLKQTLTI